MKQGFRALSSQTIIFQLTGLQFFSLNSENRNFCQKYKYSFGAALLLFTTLITAILFIKRNLFSSPEELSAVSSLQIYIILLFVIFSMSYSLVKSKSAFKFFKNLEEVLKTFESCFNFTLDYEAFGRKFSKVCCFVFLIIFGITGTFLIFLYRSNANKFLSLYTFIFMLVFLFSVIVFIRFIFFTMLIDFNLSNFERFIRKIKQNLNVNIVTTKNGSS